MENASKALIIAAAVLVAIVLVATGVLLIKNIGDTAGQAHKVGNSISEATGNASFDAIGGTKGVIISKNKFNSFTSNLTEKYKTSSAFLGAINQQNNKLSNQIEVIGYVYKGNHEEYREAKRTDSKYMNLLSKFDRSNQENNKEFFNYVINDWIPSLDQQGLLEEVEKDDSIESIRKTLIEVHKDTSLGEENAKNLIEANKGGQEWFFDYDEWGYLNKAIYIAVLDY